MTSWIDVAQESNAAAWTCFSAKHFRSCASRSYYAIFAAVIAALHKAGLKPSQGRETWSHSKLQDLVRNNLEKTIGRGRVKDIRRLINENYRMRLIADYISSQTIDDNIARRCLSNASSVLDLLEKSS